MEDGGKRLIKDQGGTLFRQRRLENNSYVYRCLGSLRSSYHSILLYNNWTGVQLPAMAVPTHIKKLAGLGSRSAWFLTVIYVYKSRTVIIQIFHIILAFKFSLCKVTDSFTTFYILLVIFELHLTKVQLYFRQDIIHWIVHRLNYIFKALDIKNLSIYIGTHFSNFYQ